MLPEIRNPRTARPLAPLLLAVAVALTSSAWAQQPAADAARAGVRRSGEMAAMRAWRPQDLPTSDRLAEGLGRHMLSGRPIEADARLHRAAWTLLRFTQGLEDLRVEGVVRGALDGVGVTDPMVFPIEVRSGTLESALAELATTLEHGFRRASFNRIGLAVWSREGLWRLMALLVERRLDLEEPPPWVPEGSVYAMRGEVLVEAPSASVLVLRPDGTVVEIAAEIDEHRLLAHVPLEGKGLHRIEVLLGGDPEHPALPAALFNVRTHRPRTTWDPGEGHTDRPELRLLPAMPGPFAEAEMAAHIRRWTDALRREHGLGALWSDPRLDDVARALAQDLSHRRTLAHTDSSGRGPSQRLRDAGLRPSEFGENVAVGFTIEEVQRGLEWSPSHRREILRRGVNRIGVGVANREGVLFVVQVLARL